MVSSIGFPRMFGSNTTNIVQGKDAVRSDLILLLGSEKRELFGDPYFGTNLKKVLFEQNNNIIVDLIIDDIYTAIITYLPQLFVKRKDITIYSNRTDVFATINGVYVPDGTSDMYNIKLTSNEAL